MKWSADSVSPQEWDSAAAALKLWWKAVWYLAYLRGHWAWRFQGAFYHWRWVLRGRPKVHLEVPLTELSVEYRQEEER